MVDNIVFPVFVVSKDRNALRKFTSLEDLCKNLEQIDIENQEYDAWDGAGLRLEMFVLNERLWLGMRSMTRGVSEFRDALIRFGAVSGVHVEPASMDSENPIELFEIVERGVRAKMQQLPWHRRLLRRF